MIATMLILHVLFIDTFLKEHSFITVLCQHTLYKSLLLCIDVVVL